MLLFMVSLIVVTASVAFLGSKNSNLIFNSYYPWLHCRLLLHLLQLLDPKKTSKKEGIWINSMNGPQIVVPTPMSARIEQKYSNLERLEASLGYARAAIKEAITTSEDHHTTQDPKYTPTGPIYWNATAFHRSDVANEEERRRRKNNHHCFGGNSPKFGGLSAQFAFLEYTSGAPVQFSYKELQRATKGFMEKLGARGFGVVYRCVLANKTIVVVKQLKGMEQGEGKAGEVTGRSYLEMEKQLKVFVYEEEDPPVFHCGPCKHTYAIEGLFIQSMEISKFRTRDPERAHLFFLPFSVTMITQVVYVVDSHDWSPMKNTAKDYVDVIANK
ncbi:unnamed protein product [Camellia sinensis]